MKKQKYFPKLEIFSYTEDFVFTSTERFPKFLGIPNPDLGPKINFTRRQWGWRVDELGIWD